MGYLWKKLFRDIKGNWTQFVSVLLMATISVLIFSGMASVWTGLEKEVDEFVDESNMAMLWVKSMSLTDEDMEKIGKINGIESMSRCMSIQLSTTEGDGELKINMVDDLSVSKPVTMSGVEFDNERDGIYVDENYMNAHNLQVGDKFSVDGYLGTVELEIKGSIMSPEYIYYTGNNSETVPNYEKYGYAYVSEGTMLELSPVITYTELKLINSEDIDDTEFSEILGDRFICVQDREDYTTFARSTQESAQMRKMAILFSVVFVLLALMTMYTSMTRLVNRQMSIIGTMKALGVTNRNILLHYASYGFFIPIIGGVLGLIIGRFTVSKALMKVKQTTMYLPKWQLIHSKLSFGLIGVITLCCVLAAICAVNHCLKGVPVEIMRGSSEMKKKKSFESNGGIIEKFSYEWRWVLRNMRENKVRFIMGIVGVFGGMVLLIAGLGVKDAIGNSNDFVFNTQFNYVTKAMLTNAGETFEWNGDIEWVQESMIEIRTFDEVKQSTMVVADEGNLLCYYDDDDAQIELPNNGAVMSRKLAKDIGIEEGEIIEVRVFGTNKWIKVTIKQLTKTLTPQGIMLSKEAYENLDMKFAATCLLTTANDGEELAKLDEVKSYITKTEQRENTDTVADSVMSIVKLLIAASVVLSIVILYNLGILNYVERARDYATMKVIGFHQSEIRSIAIRECLVTTFIGWIFGLFGGQLFLKIYVKIISFDAFEWIPTIDTKILVIASVVIIGTSIIVNLFLSEKVRRIVMVEALKSVE